MPLPDRLAPFFGRRTLKDREKRNKVGRLRKDLLHVILTHHTLHQFVNGMNTDSSAKLNPYHAEGYSRLVSTSAKHDYSHNCSKCSSTPSGTIVLYWAFGSKIDSRRCYPLFIILYIFLRWGHSFLVYIVPILCHMAKKMKTTKLS